MAASSRSIMMGRDRISEVLEPLLGSELALERANNIAQVLVLITDDVADVAFGMLRNTGLSDARAVAHEVARAWHRGKSRPFGAPESRCEGNHASRGS